MTRSGPVPRWWRLLVAAVLLVLGAGAGPRAAGDPFVQEAKGVVVDWRHGTVSARGVAAADWRTPSAEMARAGAERRARNEGRSRLVEALRVLPLGGGRHLDAPAITRAVEHARTVHVDYQSNGGVVLQVEIAFGDWDDSLATKSTAADVAAPLALPVATPLALRMAEGSLAAAPALLVGTREVALASVSYAPSGDLAADVRPLVVRADKKGRLVADEKLNPDELAHRHAVIYVQKLLR